MNTTIKRVTENKHQWVDPRRAFTATCQFQPGDTAADVTMTYPECRTLTDWVPASPQENVTRAKADYTQALRSFGLSILNELKQFSHPGIAISVAKSLIKLGEKEEAIGVLRSTVNDINRVNKSDYNYFTYDLCLIANEFWNLGEKEEALGITGPLKCAESYSDSLCAATALAQFGREDEAIQITEAIDINKDIVHNVRSQVAETLGEIGGNRAIELLEDLLKKPASNQMGDEVDSYVREQVVKAIIKLAQNKNIKGRMQTDKAFEILEGLKNDKCGGVRSKVAEALRELGGNKAITILLESLKNDEDPDVCCHAAIALEKLGQHDHALLTVEKLKDKDFIYRDSMIIAVAKIFPYDRALDFLKSLTQNDHKENWTKIRALGELGGTEALKLLESLRKTVNEPSLQHDIARALIKLGRTDEALEILHGLKSSDCSLYVARDLGKLGRVDEALEILSHLKGGKGGNCELVARVAETVGNLLTGQLN